MLSSILVKWWARADHAISILAERQSLVWSRCPKPRHVHASRPLPDLVAYAYAIMPKSNGWEPAVAWPPDASLKLSRGAATPQPGSSLRSPHNSKAWHKGGLDCKVTAVCDAPGITFCGKVLVSMMRAYIPYQQERREQVSRAEHLGTNWHATLGSTAAEMRWSRFQTYKGCTEPKMLEHTHQALRAGLFRIRFWSTKSVPEVWCLLLTD